MSFDSILDTLPRYRKRMAELSEIMLANLVMIAEIPAPTFSEERRTGFVLDRMNEYQLLNCSTDEVGNGLGILPGEASLLRVCQGYHRRCRILQPVGD